MIRSRRRTLRDGTVSAPRTRQDSVDAVAGEVEVDEELESPGSETETEEPRGTVARAKGETTEERRARKAVVKAERSVRQDFTQLECCFVPHPSFGFAIHLFQPASLYHVQRTSRSAHTQARRLEKKAHRDAFTGERRRQIASHKRLVADGRAADLTVVARGVVSLT